MVYNFFITQSTDKVTIFHGTHPATRIIRFDNRDVGQTGAGRASYYHPHR